MKKKKSKKKKQPDFGCDCVSGPQSEHEGEWEVETLSGHCLGTEKDMEYED